MKRKAPGRKRNWDWIFALQNIKPELLAAFGAVTLAWNQVDGMIDSILCAALQLHSDLRVDVRSRINGFDGKIGIIKKALQVHFGTFPDVCRFAQVSLGACELYKTYRDGVAHARPNRGDDPIAVTADKRGDSQEY
jgi:hypothetical protein